jgi:glutamine amidotransferase-like uncharacterized protein
MSRQAARKPVAVYSDQKAMTAVSELFPRLQSSFPDRIVKGVETDEFVHTLTTNSAAMAVVPGICGETCNYYDMLGGKDGQKNIAAFVEKGGLLLTVCAGSYLIAHKTEYIPPWGPAKERINLAALFNATARGPIVPLAQQPHGPEWYQDVTTVPVDYKGRDGQWRETRVAYGNGPALFPYAENPDLEVLARYKGIPDEPIAAAWLKVGKGAILWLGVLPYMGHNQDMEKTPVGKIRDLMLQLKPFEAGREDFWSALVGRMQDHLKKMETGPSPLQGRTP